MLQIFIKFHLAVSEELRPQTLDASTHGWSSAFLHMFPIALQKGGTKPSCHIPSVPGRM